MIAVGQLVWWWNHHYACWELFQIVAVDADSPIVQLQGHAGYDVGGGDLGLNARRQLGRAEEIDRQVSYRWADPAELVPAHTMDGRRRHGAQEEFPCAA